MKYITTLKTLSETDLIVFGTKCGSVYLTSYEGMYVCMYMCMYVCKCMYVCIYICIYVGMSG